MENPKFQIFKGKDDQFYFRLHAANGENILKSEGYKVKASAENGIESVKTNAADDARFDKKDSDNEKVFFTLKAKNGEVIGMSQMYSSKEARDKGIHAVMNVAPNAPVEDTAN